MSTRIVRKISAIVATAGLAVGTAALVTPASSQAAVEPQLHAIDHSMPVWMTTPCEVEDASDCYWDASSMGNKVGHSFYAVRVGGGQVCIRFWDYPAENYCMDDAYPID